MADKKFTFRRAATIKVPEEFFKPIVTKIKEVDESWSELGGIVPSQVTFITGNPGAGKTTLTLAIGACVANQSPVAFISLEMSEFQLANQAKKIPGFGMVHVTGDFHQEMTLESLQELKPGLVILDSIQKAARKMKDENDKPMPFDRAQFSIVEMFTKFAKDTWTPVFLIGHCDKSGNYKGPSDLLHDVDSHLMVNYDREMDLRTFCFGKNRFGGVMEESLFGITRDTVWVGSPYITRAYPGSEIMMKEPEDEAPEEVEEGSKLSAAIQELKKGWSGGGAKLLIKEVVEKLKKEDPEFEDRAVVKNRSKVKLAFRGNSVAHCFHRTGEIVFGKKSFTMMQVGKIGYGKEQKYITPRCTDSVDMLLWVIVHEWCHLYEGNQHHKNAFFEEVARKYDWLIANL